MGKYILLLSLFIFPSIFLNSQPLSIEIKLDKKEFLIHEPIFLLIEITNVSNEQVIFNFGLFTQEFQLNVTYNNSKLDCGESGVIDAVTSEIFLDSGNKYYETYQMFPFGCTNNVEGKKSLLRHLVEGNYTIELEYNFGKTVLKNEKQLILKSNTLEFLVEKPNSNVLIAQLEKYKNLIYNYKNFNSESFESAMFEIVNIARNSPYSLLAQYRIITKFKGLSSPTNYRRLMKKACKDFPNSFVSLSFGMYDATILNLMSTGKAFEGTLVQKIRRKVQESRKK